MQPGFVRAEGATHFLAPGKRGRPTTSPWPLCSRPTVHASSPTLDASRSLGFAVDVARRAGSSTSHPAGAQHATKCYVFRFFRKFGEPCFRRKFISIHNLRLFLAWLSWNATLDVNPGFKRSCAVMRYVAYSPENRLFDPISGRFTLIRPTDHR